MKIREMERARGQAEGVTPVAVYAAAVVTAVAQGQPGLGAWVMAALLWLVAAYCGFAWWMFWTGCRDYDRRRRLGRGS